MDATFLLLDTPCRIICTDADAAARLRRVLAPFETSGTREPTEEATVAPDEDDIRIVLTFRGERYVGRRSPVLARFISQLTAAAIDGFDGFAVHAGVVARDRRAVVLAAASGTGKSTLTAACLQRGFEYLSDEALCIPPGTSHAVAFPKPIAISGASAQMLDLRRQRWDTKDLLPPAAFGARITEGLVPVRHVVSLVRGGSGLSKLEELDRSTAVATLLGMSFNAHRDPTRALDVVTAIARAAQSWRLELGDPILAADSLYEVAGSDPSA